MGEGRAVTTDTGLQSTRLEKAQKRETLPERKEAREKNQ